MASRPPSSSSAGTGATSMPTTSASRGHPTPHNTVSRSRSHSSSRVPPQAPKASRRPTTSCESSSSTSLPPNPPSALLRGTTVPRASWSRADDILGPPDTQACPFAKAGLKLIGAGTGGYGELEGCLEWPAELYANERKEQHIATEIKAIYSQDERLRSKETTTRLLESLRSKMDKLKDDEWMYASTDTLFTRRT